jgi:molybdopterin-containing oxidoreductase family iron-sulfur binding subunit
MSNLPRSTDDSAEGRVEKLVETRLDEKGTRRHFLKLAGAAAGTAAVASSTGCATGTPTFEEFFQQHYKRLSDEEKKVILKRLEDDTEAKTGVKVKIGDPPPIPGVEFGYALNLSLCNGNRRCVEACARENNLPDDIRYIRVLEMHNGSFDMEHADPFYEHHVPMKGKFYLPVQCHQCENPPCVKACPVGATWKEKDGIVVVDYNWCIGCRYCQAACPYFARRFNWQVPQVEPQRINPDQAYLSNRLRPTGVVEKCTFCLQRSRNGRFPACLEACPTGARKFGNLKDPTSEIREILESKRVYVLKEELGTVPRFFYFFG